MIKNIDNQ